VAHTQHRQHERAAAGKKGTSKQEGQFKHTHTRRIERGQRNKHKKEAVKLNEQGAQGRRGGGKRGGDHEKKNNKKRRKEQIALLSKSDKQYTNKNKTLGEKTVNSNTLRKAELLQ
jgi:hypothetical protein